MSVIAKLVVRNIVEFGSGALYEMGCICENDLMVNWTSLKSDEDRMFTKASPSGEARLHLNISAQWPQAQQGDTFYFVMCHKDEPGFTEKPAGAFLTCPARVSNVNDFGGTTKHVDMAGNQPTQGNTLQNFSWRMSIDNPGASDQLKPGTSGWQLSLFKATDFTIRSAIDAAHGDGELKDS